MILTIEGERHVARPKRTSTAKTRRRTAAGTTPQTSDGAGETARAVPSPEEVERRAYELYKARGAEPGAELDDWLQAERELLDPSDASRSA